MFRQRLGLSLAVLALVPFAPLAATAQSNEEAGFVPVTDVMLEDPAPGDWLMWRRTLDGWGFRCECAVKS
jgi:alcohol dehydrogenase (cytochrome c)